VLERPLPVLKGSATMGDFQLRRPVIPLVAEANEAPSSVERRRAPNCDSA
jgi:hypothetical protein